MDRHRLPERRACELPNLHRSVFQHKTQEAPRKRLSELANERRRFSYRCLGILLAREGVEVKHKAVPPLSRGLAVRRRRSRKRAVGTRSPILVPDRANRHPLSADCFAIACRAMGSLDFVSDAFEDGQRSRMLCIVDDCTREALATFVDRSLSGARMTRELDDLICRRGPPDMIVSVNGMEMTSHAVLRCCQDTGVG